MVAQITRPFGRTVAAEVGRAADDRHPERQRQPHRDHVGGDELAEPDAGIETAGRDVDQFLTGGDLDLDLRIGPAERGQQRLQQHLQHPARDRKTQAPGRPAAEIARGLAGGDKLDEGGPRLRQEPGAGLGQAHAAGRADEKRGAEAGLERPHRLADRGGRHAELGRRAAEAAMLGHAEEGLDPVERSVADREVLLHGPSTLSAIARPEKRAWIVTAQLGPCAARSPGPTNPPSSNCLSMNGDAMSVTSIFLLQMVLGYLPWLLLLGTYARPRLRQMSRLEAHRAIAILHSFRFFGLVFLVPGVVGTGVPAGFAVSAAYGDFATGVLAMLALLVARRRPLFWAFTIAFNLVGTLDLLANYLHGSELGLLAFAGELGAAYMIPVLYVPLLMITHVVAFSLLAQAAFAGAPGYGTSAPQVTEDR